MSHNLLAAATDPENSVVVHAAAGTGKTWLLTSRIIRLLLAGSEPGAILAITFTRKAAGEIQERITARLLALASSDEATLIEQLTELGAKSDTTSRALARGLYEKHLNAIHILRATTFHSFCQDILRRFPLEADVPTGFELIETTADLQDAAWLTLDRKLSRECDSPVAQAMDLLLKECGGVLNTRKALNDFLAHRGDWWAYTEEAVDPVALSTTRLQKLLQVSDDVDPIAAFVQDMDLRQMIARYGELLAGHPTATNQKFIDKLIHALSNRVPAARAFSEISEVLLTGDGTPRQLKLSQTLVKRIGTGQATELTGLHAALTQRLLAAQKTYKRHWTYRVSRAWYACGAALLAEYQRLKAEQGLLDFADLEWKTYRLLKRSHHAEWVQYKLDQRIDHLLVDEFQDTNPTQWRLLLPLLEEMAAGDPERHRSIFIVGDEKQSIYRFRRADPRLFHGARHWLQQQARAQTLTQHISWRSSPAIIGFVNLIFHRDGADGADAASDYILQDFLPHATHREQLWGRAELLPLIRNRSSNNDQAANPAWRNPLSQPRLTDEDQRHREEADLIADKIREILGMPVPAEAGPRPLEGSDIMILLRDRTHARLYEEALRRAGIPYIGTGRGAFLQSLEIRDLMHLLQTLVEPYNNLALASTLRSPIFAASEVELIRLAQHPPEAWYEQLMRLPPDEARTSALARARHLLPHWRGYADLIPVHDLLDRIYNEGNIIARYTAAVAPPMRARVEANLNRFLELALEVDSGRYPSLAHFLAYLNQRSQDDSASPAEPAWNRDPRVRVMTIHAAKGLEAAVVFLADAARDTGDRERGLRSLIDWPVADAHPRYFHLVGNKDRQDDISQALMQEQLGAVRREETNLLYVALTRAKQLLFVTGCEPSREARGRGWYGFIENRLRRAENTEAAARAGLELFSVPTDDGSAVFNTYARLRSGSPESLKINTSHVSPAKFTMDPSLTMPFAASPDASAPRPSRSVINADDDGPEQLDSPSEARTLLQRRGVVIHRMLERLAGSRTRSSVEKKLRDEFSDWPTTEEFNAWWQEACDVVDDPGLSDLFAPDRCRMARNEVPILYREADRDVFGIIDRLVIRETEILVIDYKTHPQADPESIGPLAENFSEQMRRYGTGVHRLWPQKKLRLVLLFTACRRIVELTP